VVRAVLFDFGGVILTSPFDAFNRYEAEAGLPPDTIRRLNATEPDRNAWARFERGELDEAGFMEAFRLEARVAGHEVDVARILEALRGDLRPAMVEAVRRCAFRLKTALLTNNFRRSGGEVPDAEVVAVTDLFHEIIESSVVGVRKPEVDFYRLACDRLGVGPEDCVFLDDLGVNLKPARAMGMTTIKVEDPDVALGELEEVVGFALR